MYMSQEEIKSIFKKYKLRASGILAIVLIAFIYMDFYLKNHNVEQYAELNLPYHGGDLGYIWLGLGFGLFTVLQLCFYYFEKILLNLLIKPAKNSE